MLSKSRLAGSMDTPEEAQKKKNALTLWVTVGVIIGVVIIVGVVLIIVYAAPPGQSTIPSEFQLTIQ
jgi:heme/copper-type cytochrome/quinol oxidase subunit 2